MSRTVRRALPGLLLVAVAAAPAAGPDPSQWRQTVDKAVAYFRSAQAADGSWSRDRSPGASDKSMAARKAARSPRLRRPSRYAVSTQPWTARAGTSRADAALTPKRR